jgi:DNA mismatch repair ATPase MutS
MGHSAESLSKGWVLPKLDPHTQVQSDNSSDRTMQVQDILPYWLRRGQGVPNTFDLQGTMLLTAPNMSGKSTLLRTLCATALLANGGLFVPASAARVPWFDNYFLRTGGHDVPTENKSAFALEVNTSPLLRSSRTQLWYPDV